MDVIVVGSFVMALTERVPRMPHVGESLVADLLDVGPGGKGTNLAVAVARQGKRVGLIAKLGADMFADVALRLYAEEGIATDFVSRDSREPTGVALVYLEPSGDNRIAVYRGANWLLSPEDVEAIAPHAADACVLTAQLEIPDATVAAAVALGRRLGAQVILNPAPARPLPAEILAGVDVLTPNEGEARLLLGLAPGDESVRPAEAARRLLASGPRAVIVTLGAQGCLIVQPDAQPVHLPAHPVTAVDTVGAGDAFSGGLAVALAEGKPLLEAARWANVTAALSVMHLGAIPGLPRRELVARHVAAPYSAPSASVSEA
jgi:ribokinase